MLWKCQLWEVVLPILTHSLTRPLYGTRWECYKDCKGYKGYKKKASSQEVRPLACS